MALVAEAFLAMWAFFVEPMKQTIIVPSVQTSCLALDDDWHATEDRMFTFCDTLYIRNTRCNYITLHGHGCSLAFVDRRRRAVARIDPGVTVMLVDVQVSDSHKNGSNFWWGWRGGRWAICHSVTDGE